MKIYLAARFSRRHEAHALGVVLQKYGHEIVSQWIQPEVDHSLPPGLSEQAEFNRRQELALEDRDDVRACDWLIALTEEPRTNGRGGRHHEMGIADGLDKHLTVIGPQEHVFHCLPEITHFNNKAEFTEWLRVGGGP